MVDFHIENECRAKGFAAVCGIDEAGRGPYAGPVYAAAVMLPRDCYILGLNDSKKLTAKQRERLLPVIEETAISIGIGSATVEEIDDINILQATFLAMRRAVAAMPVPPDFALVDGNQVPPGLGAPVRCVIHGDALSASIAAASVIAKVTRDRYMIEMSEKYPEYDFAHNKGYGSVAHRTAIGKYGLCEIHRKSYNYDKAIR